MRTTIQNIVRHGRIGLIGLAVAGLVATPYLATRFAMAATPVAPAKVSFTFDDGLTSAVTQAAPTLAKYGLTGTDYVITGCVGMTTAPNTCHANTDNTYMSWTQVSTLANTYKWEIGSHTKTHPYLATSDATDGQPNRLTDAQVVSELSQSKSDLAAHGINATAFSSPYGDYNTYTLSQIAKLYSSHRGFADVGPNESPYNDYLLNDYQVQGGVTVAQVKAKIDAAIASGQWLVLTFHDIRTSASSNPDDYQYSTANLDAIAAYVKAKQDAGSIKSTNITAGLSTGTTNLLGNGSFNEGIAGGWTTDNATALTKDSAGNGSYPDPTNSIKFTAGTSSAHLFSPKVSVTSATTYLLKNFLNVQTIKSGEVAFYIDEYDANGNWISGQYKSAERSPFVEDINFNYTPSSRAVTHASLQFIVQGGSGATGYLDNAQWYAMSTATQPAQTNLMPNHSFDSGLSGGWTTNDPTNITADTANHGSTDTPATSIRLAASTGTANHHLFSPHITVANGKTYSLASYLNVQTITSGEVGFYIDEYDANGNWISGQYKTGITTSGSRDVTMTYQPSSANVVSAGLQVIVMPNSGTVAYLDNVRWYAD